VLQEELDQGRKLQIPEAEEKVGRRNTTWERSQPRCKCEIDVDGRTQKRLGKALPRTPAPRDEHEDRVRDVLAPSPHVPRTTGRVEPLFGRSDPADPSERRWTIPSHVTDENDAVRMKRARSMRWYRGHATAKSTLLGCSQRKQEGKVQRRGV